MSQDQGEVEAHAQNFLRVIVDPGEKAEIDIVAVHGLNPTNNPNHAESTWTKGDKLWLRDYLPEAVPTARIMLFGYNANVAFEASSAGVLEQGSNLLNRLRTKRRKDKATDRPIIFIAHSLGGIVVKRALITAGQVDRYVPIRRATHGMVFFATPHRGGEHGQLGSIAVKIVRAVYSSPKNSFMEALEKDSMFGDSIVQDFCNMAEDYKVISFYETRPLPGIGIIVDHKSANLGLSSNRENRIALDLDHRSICKFDSMNDDYEQVQDNISELIEEAIDAVQRRHAILGLGIVSEPSLPLMPRLDSNHDSIKSEPAADLASVSPDDSMSQLAISTPLSDPEPSLASTMSSPSLDDRRRSSSTVATEFTTIDGAVNPLSPVLKNTRRQVQSPSTFSSISMNISDSAGTKLRSAAAEGKLDIVRHLVEKQNAPVDNSGVWDGYTALAEASLHGQEEVVAYLLACGANPAFHCISMTSKYGSKENTPLSLAAARGHIGSMRLLLDAHRYAQSELDGAARAAKERNRSDVMRLFRQFDSGLG